jgi:hypothetical protein
VATAVGALVATAGAQALACPTTPLEERIADAQLVFVGRSTGYTPISGEGVPQRLYRFTVDQKVKGDIGDDVVVRIPVRAANGGQRIPQDVAAGILANRAGGTWFTTRCGITDPGAVLATVDEPKGNAIKLAIGILILAAVLGYSVLRLRRKNATPPGSAGRRRV